MTELGEGPRASAWTAGYAAVITSFALARLDTPPYDDAHFFERIALNALERGALAWNVEDGPVHGITSHTFQAIVLVLEALTRHHTMLAVRALSVLSLIAAFLGLFRLTRREDRGVSLAFAFTTAPLFFPAVSGMETALAVAGVTGLLILLYGEGADHRGFFWAPLAVVFLYLTRPDAALLGIGLLVARRTAGARLPVRELVLAGCLLGVVLVACHAYFGSALPLSFYAKQRWLTPYDPAFVELSRVSGWQRFFVFAIAALPLTLRALTLRDRENLGLVAVSLAFAGFHLVSTVDVMGMHGRFYVPCLPLLVLASARAGSRQIQPTSAVALAAAFLGALVLLLVSGSLPLADASNPDTVPAWLIALAGVAGFALLLSLARPSKSVSTGVALGTLALGGAGSLSSIDLAALRLYGDRQYLELQAMRQTAYRGLDTLEACVGDTLHVYHSEVGLPGLRFQHGRVTDLSGLFGRSPLDRQAFERTCERDTPEAIFLPHRNYRELVRLVESSRCLRRYRKVVEHSSSPLFVRSDLTPRFLECARGRQDPFVLER